MAAEHKQCPHILTACREHLVEQGPGQGGKQRPQCPQPCMRHGAHPQSSHCFKKLQSSCFPAQANMDLCCRPYLDALSESRGGVKTYRAFCKLGMEQSSPQFE